MSKKLAEPSAEMFPTRVRYTALSVSYGFAVVLFGGFAPLISTWLVEVTGNPFAPAFYVMTGGGPANGTQSIAFYTYQKAFSDEYFGYGSALAYLIVLFILVLAVIYIRLLRSDSYGMA